MNTKSVIVESTERVSRGFLNIDKISLRHSTPEGGMTGTVVREVMNRGNAAAVLIYDPMRESVLLVEEFRIGNLAAGLTDEACWSLGPVAGMIDSDETGISCVIREAREELGITLEEKQIFGPIKHFSSPGGTSEQLEIFVAVADITTADPDAVDNDADEHTSAVILTLDALDAMIFAQSCPASLVTAYLLLSRVMGGGVHV